MENVWFQKPYLGVFKPTMQVAAQSTATALPNQQGNQAFVKENEKISV